MAWYEKRVYNRRSGRWVAPRHRLAYYNRSTKKAQAFKWRTDYVPPPVYEQPQTPRFREMPLRPRPEHPRREEKKREKKSLYRHFGLGIKKETPQKKQPVTRVDWETGDDFIERPSLNLTSEQRQKMYEKGIVPEDDAFYGNAYHYLYERFNATPQEIISMIKKGEIALQYGKGQKGKAYSIIQLDYIGEIYKHKKMKAWGMV